MGLGLSDKPKNRFRAEPFDEVELELRTLWER